jgi:predicted nucleic acid-binding protein
MTQIFVDTWFLIALTHRYDVSHKIAKSIASRLGSTNLVTSEGVLTEYLNFFSKYGENIRKAAATTVELMKSNRQLEIVHQDHE